MPASDPTLFERKIARASAKRIGIALAVALCLVALAFLFFACQLRAGQHEANARDLYYAALRYQARQASLQQAYTDARGQSYDLLTDKARLEGYYDQPGDIEIGFYPESGDIAYAKWTKTDALDWIDRIIGNSATYAKNGQTNALSASSAL